MAIKIVQQLEMLVAPTGANQLVRVQDMEDYVAGKLKSPVLAATTVGLDADYDGANKTLTAKNDGALVVDGVTVAVGDRILVKDQADKTQNGIYVVTETGDASNPFVLTRDKEFDRSEELISGVRIPVAQGTSNSGDWKLSSPPPLTLDSSNLEFTRATPLTEAVAASYPIVGDGTKTQFDFSHSWGTKGVFASIYDATTDEEIITDFKCLSVNDVRVSFGYAPAVGENYRLELMAVLKN